MMGRPRPDEFAPYYRNYIDMAAGDDPIRLLEDQLNAALAIFSGISEARSLFRYAPDKWSIRQILNHLTDTERVFAFRAFWFARGFETPLADYDQDIAAAGAEADLVTWQQHVEEFRWVRLGTLSLFKNMPAAAWARSGIASNNRCSIRALAYIMPGHVAHHLEVLRQRYL